MTLLIRVEANFAETHHGRVRVSLPFLASLRLGKTTPCSYLSTRPSHGGRASRQTRPHPHPPPLPSLQDSYSHISYSYAFVQLVDFFFGCNSILCIYKSGGSRFRITALWLPWCGHWGGFSRGLGVQGVSRLLGSCSSFLPRWGRLWRQMREGGRDAERGSSPPGGQGGGGAEQEATSFFGRGHIFSWFGCVCNHRVCFLTVWWCVWSWSSV